MNSGPKTDLETKLPERRWYEQLNLLNILIILFLFLAIFSGKNLIQDNRPADVMSGIRYFLKKFFPPDFSDFPIILESLGETFQIAIVSTFISIILSLGIALAASRNLSPTWLVQSARMLLNITRTLAQSDLGISICYLFWSHANCRSLCSDFYSLGLSWKVF
jgi:phosphonate transport system permease protein